MSPTADPGSAEAKTADRVIAAIKLAIKGDPQPFAALAQNYAEQPKMLAVITAAACSAAFAVVAKQETRIAALEARPKGLVYLGTWTDGDSYGVGDCVTRSGSLWTSRVNENKAIPGADGGVSWTLCAKRGADGKDARR